jgi:crotonobetainyl-CoA:carnitine CoA-transferase CaiB-like acyl-CoA transferase
VCAHLSAYGRQGPRKSWPGFDYLMQAETGYLSLTGEPDGPPARMGLSIVDMMTGLMAVFGLASGVIGARASGKGMDVDVSLFDTALHNLSYLAVWYLNGGQVQGREARSGHPSLVPSQLYRTKDGWLFIMCNKENFWPVLAERVGRPEWASDPRFATFKARLENRELLQDVLEEVLTTRTTAAWLEVMQGAVPAAPVYDIAQALESPFVAASDRIGSFSGGASGATPFRMLAGPVRIDGEGPPTRAGPAYGADTQAVLLQLGYDNERIDRLRRDRVI